MYGPTSEIMTAASALQKKTRNWVFAIDETVKKIIDNFEPVIHRLKNKNAETENNNAFRKRIRLSEAVSKKKFENRLSSLYVSADFFEKRETIRPHYLDLISDFSENISVKSSIISSVKLPPKHCVLKKLIVLKRTSKAQCSFYWNCLHWFSY